MNAEFAVCVVPVVAPCTDSVVPAVRVGVVRGVHHCGHGIVHVKAFEGTATAGRTDLKGKGSWSLKQVEKIQTDSIYTVVMKQVHNNPTSGDLF